MNYKFEKAEKSTVKVFITLDKDEWNDAQVQAYNKTKGRYSVPGFRKGHVPMKKPSTAHFRNIIIRFSIKNPPSKRLRSPRWT